MLIDSHVHPFMIQELMDEDPQLENAVKEIFGLLFPAQPLEILLKEMDAAGVDMAVLLPIDCSTAHNCKIVSNEQLSELCRKTDRFIGFCSVDPNLTTAGEDLEKAVKELGLKGLKLDPALQKFDPSSKDIAYPVYQKAAELKIPVIVHCGLNWSPPASIKDGNPLSIENAIIDNPKTNFIIPHLGWPWVNEASALAMKYPNVYLDTSVVYSGTPAECLDHVINKTMGKELFERNLVNKVIYGSNYPRADMRRTVRGMRKIGFDGYFSRHLFELSVKKLLNWEV